MVENTASWESKIDGLQFDFVFVSHICANKRCMKSDNNQDLIEAKITKEILHSVVLSFEKFLRLALVAARDANEASSTLQPEKISMKTIRFFMFSYPFAFCSNPTGTRNGFKELM